MAFGEKLFVLLGYFLTLWQVLFSEAPAEVIKQWAKTVSATNAIYDFVFSWSLVEWLGIAILIVIGYQQRRIITRALDIAFSGTLVASASIKLEPEENEKILVLEEVVGHLRQYVWVDWTPTADVEVKIDRNDPLTLRFRRRHWYSNTAWNRAINVNWELYWITIK